MTAKQFLEEYDYFGFLIQVKDTDINPKDIEELMNDYARLKCKELLEIVAGKARIQVKTEYGNSMVNKATIVKKEIGLIINKDSIINCVDLENFCS